MKTHTRSCRDCGESNPANFGRDRRASDGLRTYCKACQRRRHDDYKRRNREKLRESRMAYVAAHREELLAADARRHASRPHIAWAKGYKKRAIGAGVPVVSGPFTKSDVIERYGDACAYCETGEFEHLDHYVPIKHGGPHTLENVRPSCAACNRAKGDQQPSGVTA